MPHLERVAQGRTRTGFGGPAPRQADHEPPGFRGARGHEAHAAVAHDLLARQGRRHDHGTAHTIVHGTVDPRVDGVVVARQESCLPGNTHEISPSSTPVRLSRAPLHVPRGGGWPLETGPHPEVRIDAPNSASLRVPPRESCMFALIKHIQGDTLRDRDYRPLMCGFALKLLIFALPPGAILMCTYMSPHRNVTTVVLGACAHDYDGKRRDTRDSCSGDIHRSRWDSREASLHHGARRRTGEVRPFGEKRQ